MTLNRAPSTTSELVNAGATLHIAGQGDNEVLYNLNSNGEITQALGSTVIGEYEIEDNVISITLTSSNMTINSLTFTN